jgi:cell wall-associated NlpC family hydrolase
LRFVRKLLILLLILTFITPVLYIEAAAANIAYGAATVKATTLNVRSSPNTSSPVTATVGDNEIVVILEKTNSEWYRINYHGAEGYVAATFLTNVLTAENFNATGKVQGDDVFFRSAPSTSSTLLGSCDAGTIVKIIGINNGWYKLKYDGNTGYMRSDFVTIIADEAFTAPAVAGAVDTAGTNAPPMSQEEITLRQQVVDFALQYVGYDYVYGAESPSSGFDCSGLVYYVFRNFGYNVNRTATSQYARDGACISKSELVAGDLVFFSSNGGYSTTHVGIYIGENQFVHASTPKVGVVVSRLDSTYYTNVWYGAKRLLP